MDTALPDLEGLTDPLSVWACDTCGHRTTDPLRADDLPVCACPNCGGPTVACTLRIEDAQVHGYPRRD